MLQEIRDIHSSFDASNLEDEMASIQAEITRICGNNCTGSVQMGFVWKQQQHHRD